MRAILPLILAAAAASACAPAQAAQEQSPGAPFIGIAGQPTIYLPRSAAAGYVAPTITAGLAIVYGDSRAANAGDATYAHPAFTSTSAFSNTWAAEVPWQTNNAVQFSYTYNYGVGAQSSAGIRSRENSALPYCNGPTGNGVCFTVADKTTTSGSTSSTNMAIASATGLSAGTYYVYLNPQSSGATNYLGPQTTITCVSACTSPVTLSAAPNLAIPSGTEVLFAAPSTVNPFWNGLDATLTGWTLTDPFYNSINVGLHSACSDPAALVFFMTGTNDGSLPTLQALKNQAAIFDAMGPSGCNKVVIAGNEIPRGLATAIQERHTIPTSPYQVTVVNSGQFYDDQGVYYAPAAASNAPGANDGVALTKVSLSPAVGQYSVLNGTYTFNSADAGNAVVTWYRWTNDAAGPNLLTIHDWLEDGSQCSGSFNDPNGGGAFAISGAQCNRPWLHVVDTWGQVIDASTGSNNYPLPFFSIDGLHPIPAFGTKIASAMAAPAAAFVGTSPQIPLPTVDNPNVAGSVFASGAAPTNACPGTIQSKQYFFTMSSAGQGPPASSGLYSVGMKLFANTTDLVAGDVVNCVDGVNNVLGLTTAASATASLSNVFVQVDPNSIAVNGLFSHLNVPSTPPMITSCNGHCGTPSTGNSVTQTVPSGWTFSLGPNNTTDLNAGTLIVNYGVETNGLGDGYDDFIVQVGGVTTSGAVAISFTSSSPLNSSGLMTAGDMHRATCRVTVSAGPNGHLAGMFFPTVSFVDASTANYNPPGDSVNGYTNWSGLVGGGGTGIEMTDKDLTNGSGGSLTLQLVTPNDNTTGFTSPTSQLKLLVSGDSPANAIEPSNAPIPVSQTVRFSRCSNQKVSN